MSKKDLSKRYDDFLNNKIIPKFKSPSTATFPKYDKSMLIEKEGIFGDKKEIETYIDSQNSFGATIRTKVKIKLDDEYNFVSVKIKEAISMVWTPFFYK